MAKLPLEIDDSVYVKAIEVYDVRFPTSLEHHGSDAIHVDPDYSCCYVRLILHGSAYCGYGLTFTCGNGTQIVCQAAKAISKLIVGRNLKKTLSNFGKFTHELTNDSQLRWLGPEKGVMHLATAAILNAFWDLWARIEGKPLWRLVCEMNPSDLITALDLSYVTDLLPASEVHELLLKKQRSVQQRIVELTPAGYPCYTTSCGWLGYTDEEVKQKCRAALKDGFRFFKMKVGANVADDKRRAQLIRREIGDQNMLAIDANQVWNVNEAISWVRELKEANIYWIEEPTCADDILGHKKIAEELYLKDGIRVATGEQCQNRVMFKQFLQCGAMQVCQIDSCRVASVGENIVIMLLANHFGVPVCPHAGGVGLCELVRHLAIIDGVLIAQTTQDRWCEFCDHLHEHFDDPALVKDGHYVLPALPGYSCKLKDESLAQFTYPDGSEWQKLFDQGKYVKPT